MTPEKRERWIHQEEVRLINYQHQHRGISFLKLLLPPVNDRKVNIVGLDNHIYRGSVPKVPEDELPPEVEEKSIDEEALYKEIRDMNFPPVPPREPLGPRRRIEGPYTLAKRLSLAPVKVDCTTGLEETLLLGRDGGLYRGTTKIASTVELEKQLRGTKRPVRKTRRQSSSRGFVEPSVVSLQVDDKALPYGRKPASLVELPMTNVAKIVELIKSKYKQEPKAKMMEPATEEAQDLEKLEEEQVTKEVEIVEPAKQEEEDSEKLEGELVTKEVETVEPAKQEEQDSEKSEEEQVTKEVETVEPAKQEEEDSEKLEGELVTKEVEIVEPAEQEEQDSEKLEEQQGTEELEQPQNEENLESDITDTE